MVAITASGSAFAQSNTASQGQPAASTLDAVTVTGSRIKRTEVETALPITVIQKSDITAQGITSAEQLLMYLNIASNSGDSLAANSGIAPPGTRGNNGVSGANLRGQGADATLVLLNGRRVATHGLAGQVVDLNSIPFSAIERVEVLRDGASAVYGTDAIGGVINFITRSDYQGAGVTTNIDATHDGGGNIYSANVIAGFGDLDVDRWNVWGTLSYKKNNILRGSDRDFANSFQPDRGLSPDTSGPPFATVTALAGGLITGGLVDPLDNTQQTRVNILDLPGAAGCEAGGDMMGPYDERIWATPVNRYACAWDYGRARTIQQPVESTQFLGRATFKISDRHQAYIEAMGSEVIATRHFEAQQISSSIGATPTAEAVALNPYPLNDLTRDTYNMVYDALVDYFGTANMVYGNPINYRWRCYACGPRQIETTTRSTRVLVGFEGELGSWDYNIGLSRAASRSSSILGSGYYYTPQLKQILGAGLLNPFLMPGQEQSAAAMAALQAASAQGVELYGGDSTSTIIDASFAGGLGFNLPGGEVQAAVGVDLRREEYSFNGPPSAGGGNAWIFGAPGDAANYLAPVSRDVKATFAEVYLPIFDSLEVTVAGRYDRYDGFGSTTNPKYSFKYQPVDWLAFRGAYSTGFKVPSFVQLFRGITETPYTARGIADPATCPSGNPNPAIPGCAEITPNILTGGNPNLAPEEAKQRSIGFVLAPSPNFNLSVDLWEIERMSTIRSGVSVDTLIADYDLFTANWIRDASGAVVQLDQRFVNTGGTLTRGVEIDANLLGELAGGNWRVHLNGNYLDTFKTKSLESQPYSANLVGEYDNYFNLPLKWKHTLGVSWAKGDWMHTLTQIYRDGYKDYIPPGLRNGVYTPSAYDANVDEYITYNYSVAWTGMENARVTLGVRNLLNTDPPFTLRYLDHGDGAAWESRVADPRGRSYNVQFEYTFW
ncbi:TonB-dependent receptor plug domain-containing protein [Luteimonas sp. RIT-PG2_3]